MTNSNLCCFLFLLISFGSPVISLGCNVSNFSFFKVENTTLGMSTVDFLRSNPSALKQSSPTGEETYMLRINEIAVYSFTFKELKLRKISLSLPGAWQHHRVNYTEDDQIRDTRRIVEELRKVCPEEPTQIEIGRIRNGPAHAVKGLLFVHSDCSPSTQIVVESSFALLGVTIFDSQYVEIDSAVPSVESAKSIEARRSTAADSEVNEKWVDFLSEFTSKEPDAPATSQNDRSSLQTGDHSSANQIVLYAVILTIFAGGLIIFIRRNSR